MTETQGTFTQWIFRSDQCQCAKPNISGGKKRRHQFHSGAEVVQRIKEPVLETFAGRYDITAVIGSGAAGSVYKATDRHLNRTVALKRLAYLEPKQVARLQHEARAASNLHHRNIITVLDFGVSDKNEPYLVMDYAEGKTLQQFIKEQECLSIDTALDITIQICEGLAHAHEKGIVHRDLNSQNVMLVGTDDEMPLVKILDFGLARVAESEELAVLALTDKIVGNPYYMSPEQIRARPADKRMDIYSVGCLLVEMLTGIPPYRGEKIADTLNLHLTAPLPTLKELARKRREELIEKNNSDDEGVAPDAVPIDDIEFPPVLESLVSRCLAKDPEERFGSMNELLAALNRAGMQASPNTFGSSQSYTPLPQPDARPSPPIKRRPIPMLLAVLISICAVIALTIKLKSPSQLQRHPAVGDANNDQSTFERDDLGELEKVSQDHVGKALSKELEKKAESGDANAQLELAKRYFEGDKEHIDYAMSFFWCNKAAAQGNAKAENALGYMYAHGAGVDPDYNQAMRWYKKAADSGVVAAQYNIGVLYERGMGVPQNLTTALQLYRKAADLGNCDAQNALARCYQQGVGVARDPQESIKWYQRSAEEGNLNALTALGRMYESGRGVGKDYAQAVSLYRRAAEKGSPAAQVNLGYMYYAGLGVQKDPEKALEYFHKAADRGDTRGELMIGHAYYNGLGVQKDNQEALKWFSKAAAKNNAQAENQLAYMYSHGEGTEANEAQATNMYRRAQMHKRDRGRNFMNRRDQFFNSPLASSPFQ